MKAQDLSALANNILEWVADHTIHLLGALASANQRRRKVDPQEAAWQGLFGA